MVATSEAAIAALESEAREIRGPLGELARTEERLEDEAQSLSDQAVAADKRLYSGEVTSPKELQALQADVDQLRRHQRAVEEQAIEIMEQREPLEAQLTAIASRHEQRSAELAAARAALANIGTRHRRRGGGGAATPRRRRRVRSTRPRSTLYERCRAAAASGIGAARLVGHTCQGCHLTIPATEVDRIGKAPPGTVAHCDNCGAILIP